MVLLGEKPILHQIYKPFTTQDRRQFFPFKDLSDFLRGLHCNKLFVKPSALPLITSKQAENKVFDYAPVGSVNRLSEVVLSLSKETRMLGVVGAGGDSPPATR